MPAEYRIRKIAPIRRAPLHIIRATTDGSCLVITTQLGGQLRYQMASVEAAEFARDALRVAKKR